MEIICEYLFREYLRVKGFKLSKNKHNLPYLALTFLQEVKPTYLTPCIEKSAFCYCSSDILAGNLTYWERELKKRISKRILVAGGRDFNDRERTLEILQKNSPESNILLTGGARGADILASRLWGELGGKVEVYRADWDRYGKSAGMIRNIEMFETGLDKVIAFWDCHSKGTEHSIKLGRKYKIEVEIYEYAI